MTRSGPRAAAALLVVGLLAGCAGSRTCWTFRDPLTPAAPLEHVEVTFLGVGGVLVRWGGAALMTAPFYSNPTMGEIALTEIHSDANRIDALLHQDVSDVRAILVGHSHYDHAMDVPFLSSRKVPGATVVGNDALGKLLAPIRTSLPGGIVSLEHRDACADPGYDVRDSRFRVRAIPSEHSAQIGKNLLYGLITFPKVALWRGEPFDPGVALPTRVGAWPAGTTLAFVIDLLEAGTDDVAFRIYYQDSPTRQPVGYPPTCLSGRPVDLAVLCVGGASELPRFPGDIVRTIRPRFVLGAHWEDFFNPREIPVQRGRTVRERIGLLPGVKPSRFLKVVGKELPPGGQAVVPCPDAVTYFTRLHGTWTIAATDAEWTTPRR